VHKHQLAGVLGDEGQVALLEARCQWRHPGEGAQQRFMVSSQLELPTFEAGAEELNT
jgi:hypothetical protein